MIRRCAGIHQNSLFFPGQYVIETESILQKRKGVVGMDFWLSFGDPQTSGGLMLCSRSRAKWSGLETAWKKAQSVSLGKSVALMRDGCKSVRSFDISSGAFLYFNKNNPKKP